ncbi:restriction endonuclease [Lysobacter korlensis]|uniref:Restriction endonuclease n=1 Tax=Lysobacter korlensis TaxID=553636 RepID=A0ABV6RMD2_9GAMM
MPEISPVLTAVIVTLIVGTVASLLVRLVYRRRYMAAAGIRALAAMRWREFSQFVITALQAQGFEAAPLKDGGSSRDPSDLLLTRDNRSWLLTCRQSPEYRVAAKQVEEMSQAVRRRGASGGVIATLGRVDRSVPRAPERIELIDGRGLWDLIAPLLPPGLHEHLTEQAQSRERRTLAIAWVSALGLGILVALAVGLLRTTPEAATAPEAAVEQAAPAAPGTAPPQAVTTAPSPAAPDSAAAPPASAPGGDDEATRLQVLEAVNTVAGVNRAVWSSRSTLLVILESETSNPRPGICSILERYEALRASRIQFQPPSGSSAAVRFAQCRLY